jgi:hypothetical protein
MTTENGMGVLLVSGLLRPWWPTPRRVVDNPDRYPSGMILLAEESAGQDGRFPPIWLQASQAFCKQRHSIRLFVARTDSTTQRFC